MTANQVLPGSATRRPLSALIDTIRDALRQVPEFVEPETGYQMIARLSGHLSHGVPDGVDEHRQRPVRGAARKHLVGGHAHSRWLGGKAFGVIARNMAGYPFGSPGLASDVTSAELGNR